MGQEDGWVHNEWLRSHSCNGHYHLLRLVIYLKWHIEKCLRKWLRIRWKFKISEDNDLAELTIVLLGLLALLMLPYSLSFT